ncbi:MAG: 50S ribosomal protein L10 [Coprobacillus sp.]|nr:50S ribosomal protein L10 [Coprobacillus sp.]
MNQDILQAKKDVVSEIVEKAKSNKTILIAEYRGLTVAQLQEIRRALAKENASLSIYKNSLVERAFDELGYTDKSLLTGPNSFIFSEDEFTGMKIISKYARRYNAALHIKGAIVEGQLCDAATVKELSKLSSKDSLISMLLSCLEAPIRSFAVAVKAVGESKAN